MAERQRVLIVEDDPGTINLLKHIVHRAGYEAILARGGKEGLRLLQEGGADLILLDLMMRDMDGWTVLETIKGDDRFGTLPVIIVSAKAPSEHPVAMENHAAEFEAYFIKPFEINELLAKISELLV